MLVVRLGLRRHSFGTSLGGKEILQHALEAPEHQQQEERHTAQIRVALVPKERHARLRRRRRIVDLGRSVVRRAQRVNKQNGGLVGLHVS